MLAVRPWAGSLTCTQVPLELLAFNIIEKGHLCEMESCQKERMPLGSRGKGLAGGGCGAVPGTQEGSSTLQ